MLLKVCGMRDMHNIKALMTLKPDFIGFIFYAKSPRYVATSNRLEIPISTKKVGVFVNADIDFIKEKVQSFQLDYIQLHGSETPEFCNQLQSLSIPIIKAFRVNEGFQFEGLNQYELYCDYFLFDAFGKHPGGNGITFSWDLLKKYQGSTPFLLSGGIGLESVEAIKAFSHKQFAGIDINSGFEKSPAQKNIKKIEQFKKELVG